MRCRSLCKHPGGIRQAILRPRPKGLVGKRSPQPMTLKEADIEQKLLAKLDELKMLLTGFDSQYLNTLYVDKSVLMNRLKRARLYCLFQQSRR
jgi:hypothetical protein